MGHGPPADLQREEMLTIPALKAAMASATDAIAATHPAGWLRALPECLPDCAGANLHDVNLNRTDLSDADLSGANLTFAYLVLANAEATETALSERDSRIRPPAEP